MPDFGFGLNLTGTFAAQLAPVNEGLAQTVPLMEKVQAEAKGLDESMKAVAASTRENAQQTKRFHLEWGNMFHSFAGFRYEAEKGVTFNVAEGLDAMAEGAHRAFEMVERLADKFVDLAKEAAHVVGETQDIDLALKLTAGEEMVERVNELAESFHNTRFDNSTLKQSWLPFIDMGVKDTQLLDDMATAAIDASTRMRTGAAGFGEGMEAFHRILQRGEIDTKGLRPLNLATDTYFKHLGAALGMTPEEAEKAAKGGKVDKQFLLHFTLKEIADKEGGALGAGSLEGGKTMGATLQRLSDLPHNLFESMSKSTGMKAMQGFLDNFVDVLGGPKGAEMMQQLDSLFLTVFGDLTGPEGGEKMRKIFTDLVEDAKSFAREFKAAWPGIKATLDDLLPVLQATAKAVGVLIQIPGAAVRAGEHLGDDVFAADEKIKSWFASPGVHYDANGKAVAQNASRFVQHQQLTKEMAAGLGETNEIAEQHGADMAESFCGGFAAKAEISSPSRVFARFGRYSAEGFAEGMEDGGDDVEAAARRALVERAFPGRGRAGGGGADADAGAAGARAAAPTINIPIVVHAAPGDDADALAEKLEAAARRAIRAVLTETGMAMGEAA